MQTICAIINLCVYVRVFPAYASRNFSCAGWWFAACIDTRALKHLVGASLSEHVRRSGTRICITSSCNMQLTLAMSAASEQSLATCNLLAYAGRIMTTLFSDDCSATWRISSSLALIPNRERGRVVVSCQNFQSNFMSRFETTRNDFRAMWDTLRTLEGHFRNTSGLPK